MSDTPRLWLVFDCVPGGQDQEARLVELEDEAGMSHGPDLGIVWNTDGEFPRLGPFLSATIAERENAALRGAVEDLLSSGVEHDDPRVGYVLMQVNRASIAAAKRALAAAKEER